MGDYSSGLCVLKDPVVFSAIEDLLKVIVPYSVLIDWFEAMKTALSSSHLVVALDCKG